MSGQKHLDQSCAVRPQIAQLQLSETWSVMLSLLYTTLTGDSAYNMLQSMLLACNISFRSSVAGSTGRRAQWDTPTTCFQSFV
jgi:hypothetical protein